MDANNIFSEKYGKDLMGLHTRMVELEQIEIVRQRSGRPHWKTEKAYRDFFAEQTEAVAIVQNGLIVQANKLLSDEMGYALEEFIGTPFIQHIHPSELPRVQKNYENRIEGKEAPVIYKTIAKHKEGGSVHVTLKAGAITYWEKPAIFVIAEIDPDQKEK
jgi:PAS domain S-box-containing protein